MEPQRYLRLLQNNSQQYDNDNNILYHTAAIQNAFVFCRPNRILVVTLILLS